MDDRWRHLFEAHLEGGLTDAEAGELRELLRHSAAARRLYWEYVEQHVLIEDVLGECRGRDLARAEEGDPAVTPSRREPLADDTPRRRWRAYLGAAAAALVAAALLLAVGLPGEVGPESVQDHTPLATVRALAGDVRVIDRRGQESPLTADAGIHAGEVVHVGDEEGRAEVVFADGTQVVLSPGTDLRFTGPPGKHLYLEKGALQVQAQDPMVVTTDHARVTAAATRFRLYREPTASRVEMEEGTARLDREPGVGSVEVTEGSFVIAGDAPEPLAPRPLAAGRGRLRHTFLRAGNRACFSADGSRLVTLHHARGWKAWDARDGTPLAAAGNGRWADGLAFTPLADTVLALGRGGAALLWKVGEPQPAETRLWERDLRPGAVSPDGRWLAQGTGRGEVAVWEADTAAGRFSLRRSLALKPSRVALSSAGPLVAVSRWGGEIHVVEVPSGRELSLYRLERTPTPLALSPDGRFVAAYANGDGLALFDRDTGRRLTLWPGEGARVAALEFSADGRTLLAGLEDGTVRGWSSDGGEALLVFDTGHRSVRGVAAATDASLLATVGDGDCVKIWECPLP